MGVMGLPEPIKFWDGLVKLFNFLAKLAFSLLSHNHEYLLGKDNNERIKISFLFPN